MYSAQHYRLIFTLYNVPPLTSVQFSVRRFEVSEFYYYKFGGHANWTSLNEAGVKLCKGGTEADGGLWAWSGEQLTGWDGREAVCVCRNCVLLSHLSLLAAVFTVPQKWLSAKFMSPATTKRLHANCQIFLSDMNQIRSSSTDLNKRRQYQIARPTETALIQTEAKRRSSQLCELT